MKSFLTIVIGLFIMGCDSEPSNYLVEDFTSELLNEVENKSQIEQFKSQPIDSAIINYWKYEEIFNDAVSKFLSDSLKRKILEESLEYNELSLNNYGIGNLIAAIVFKQLNDEIVVLDDLKNYVFPLYSKSMILYFDNSKISSIDTNVVIESLVTINEWLIDSLHRIGYYDADLVLVTANIEYQNNVEYTQLFNETIFNFIHKSPYHIIELIDQGNYPENTIKIICQNLENPINDIFDINETILAVSKLPNTKTRTKILESLNKAMQKYN